MLVAKLPGSTYATEAMKAGPRNGVYRRMPLPLTAERALRGPEHDRLAGERLLGTDDERARLGGLDQARAAPAGRCGSGHQSNPSRLLEATKSNGSRAAQFGGPAILRTTISVA